MRGSQEYLRTAGAVARELLVGAAARRWSVPEEECTAANSLITHTPSGRTLGFGAVAVEAAGMDPPQTVFLKEPDEWQLLGTPVARLDTPDKIAGKHFSVRTKRWRYILYADGKIIASSPDRISIFMNVFNVHVNRIPCGGTIVAASYRPGKFFNASLDKASEFNERQSLRIGLADGRDLACKLQYPDMASAVEADLKQLALVFSIYGRGDKAIWTEHIHAEI